MEGVGGSYRVCGARCVSESCSQFLEPFLFFNILTHKSKHQQFFFQFLRAAIDDSK